MPAAPGTPVGGERPRLSGGAGAADAAMQPADDDDDPMHGGPIGAARRLAASPRLIVAMRDGRPLPVSGRMWMPTSLARFQGQFQQSG